MTECPAELPIPSSRQSREDSAKQVAALEPALAGLGEKLKSDFAFVDRVCSSLVTMKTAVQRMEAELAAAEGTVFKSQRTAELAAVTSFSTSLFGSAPAKPAAPAGPADAA